MSNFHNQTRESTSIPERLKKEGSYHLIPLYHLLRTSKLAREGIENSGSHEFADHIYGQTPQGTWGVGYILDALLLRLPSAQAFRARYHNAKQEVHNVIQDRKHHREIDILFVPCGLGREIFEVDAELRQKNDHTAIEQVRWHGLDLNADLLTSLQQHAENELHASAQFYAGDAFNHESYQPHYDMIVSTGFTEFLDDSETLQFYKLVREKLKNQGLFYTSGMRPHRLSDFLMRQLAELHTNYRSTAKLETLIKQAGFSDHRTYEDDTGLQTMVIAQK